MNATSADGARPYLIAALRSFAACTAEPHPGGCVPVH